MDISNVKKRWPLVESSFIWGLPFPSLQLQQDEPGHDSDIFKPDEDSD